ncbi:MerR family transcriptional regulator [Flavobacterium sp. MFBS3-15]|uniref:MerR family transcriptional regulator n=1 Tax=Flavobacterium sp. MFBS3-15 TaxID=2989816 RepID=UPI002235C3BC|nr:MerR family transcriptional regulator [Flavobacterium sp. MFBS3-15]MCW4467526.1 MerR family transcriptional regulator [Flavobacterium sp. MFBS3-15]
MNNIKNIFTIKDLENLSGIKAHTIRIWEKRYNILQPLRTESNIRYYDVASLQRILNISTLNSFGYKISMLARVPEDDIPKMVKEILSNKSLAGHVVNNFKLAMMNFDKQLFMTTYNSLADKKTFGEIFYECFIPLLEEIGSLWQTDTITPAHEHFISYLIRQKLALETAKLPLDEDNGDRTYVLYLPEEEIHELGLMFLNYELQQKGYKTIYIGENVPLSNIEEIKNHFEKITFICYTTVAPGFDAVNAYIKEMNEKIVNDDTTELLLFGRNTHYLNDNIINNKIKVYSSIVAFTETLHIKV